MQKLIFIREIAMIEKKTVDLITTLIIDYVLQCSYILNGRSIFRL